MSALGTQTIEGYGQGGTSWAAIRAFIAKDMRICVSYRLQFIFQFLQIFFSVALVYFVGRMFNHEGKSGLLAQYGGDYFAFALVGLAASNYLRVGLVTITNDMRQTMNQGTLEAMCATPIGYTHMLFYSAQWQFIFETLKVILYFLIAIVIFGLQLPHVNWLGTLLCIALTAPIFMMLGVMSCAILIVVKRGDPINWIFSGLGSLLAGTMFPVEVLPNWLQWVSAAIPLTHTLEVMRRCMLMGSPVSDVSTHFWILGGFVIAVLPITVVVCLCCMRHAKRVGALATH